MDARERIVLAFVERLFLNESGLDIDGWSREHMEDVAHALEQVDQPGAAGNLRSRWLRAQGALEEWRKPCTCGAGAVSGCPSHGAKPAAAHDSTIR